jgi:phosphoenolpyruvate phosphomutase
MARLIEKSDYEGMWVSSLCHSASLGLPDSELVSLQERVELVKQIRRVSTKPIFVDIDTGGSAEHLPFIIKWFEDAGAYAVIMEDKKGIKQNSLLEDGEHELEDIDVFSEKIKVCRMAARKMQIYARLESLIAKRSKFEAVLRARAYMDAGADGIMVHSKIKVDSTEVMEVAEEIRKVDKHITLIAVPTNYELPRRHPFDLLIDANQLTRVSIKAMQDFIDEKPVELASVETIFKLCGK